MRYSGPLEAGSNCNILIGYKESQSICQYILSDILFFPILFIRKIFHFSWHTKLIMFIQNDFDWIFIRNKVEHYTLEKERS